jgi:hypothetical protein
MENVQKNCKIKQQKENKNFGMICCVNSCEEHLECTVAACKGKLPVAYMKFGTTEVH